MEKLSRREFFGFMGGGAVATLVGDEDKEQNERLDSLEQDRDNANDNFKVIVEVFNNHKEIINKHSKQIEWLREQFKDPNNQPKEHKG